jgi:hypothetical protein
VDAVVAMPHPTVEDSRGDGGLLSPSNVVDPSNKDDSVSGMDLQA